MRARTTMAAALAAAFIFNPLSGSGSARGEPVAEKQLDKCGTPLKFTYDHLVGQFAYTRACVRPKVWASLDEQILTITPDGEGRTSVHLVLDNQFAALLGSRRAGAALWAATWSDKDRVFESTMRILEADIENSEHPVAKVSLPFRASNLRTFALGDEGWLVDAASAEAANNPRGHALVFVSRGGQARLLIVGAYQLLHYDAASHKVLVALGDRRTVSPYDAKRALLGLIPLYGPDVSETLDVDTSAAALPYFGRYIWSAQSTGFVVLADAVQPDGLRRDNIYVYTLRRLGPDMRLERRLIGVNPGLDDTAVARNVVALGTRRETRVIALADGETVSSTPRDLYDERLAFMNPEGSRLAIWTWKGIKILNLPVK